VSTFHASIFRLLVFPALCGCAQSVHAAPGDDPAVRAAAGEGPGNQSRAAAQDTRERDMRALAVESTLKDVNRSLEQAPPGALQGPPPVGCPPRCPPRAAVSPQAAPADGTQRALRGNLHRLRREVVAEQTPDLRDARVEETLNQDARTSAPTEEQHRAGDQ
jgi:hypothetical protein